MFKNFTPIPLIINLYISPLCHRESKALRKSTKQAYIFPLFFFKYFEIKDFRIKKTICGPMVGSETKLRIRKDFFIMLN